MIRLKQFILFLGLVSVVSGVSYTIDITPQTVILGQPINVSVKLENTNEYRGRVYLKIRKSGDRSDEMVFEMEGCSLHYPYTRAAHVEGCTADSTSFMITFNQSSTNHIGRWIVEAPQQDPQRSNYISNHILYPPQNVTVSFPTRYVSRGKLSIVACQVLETVTTPINFTWSRIRNSVDIGLLSSEYKTEFDISDLQGYIHDNEDMMLLYNHLNNEHQRERIELITWIGDGDDDENDTFICTASNKAGSTTGNTTIKVAYIQENQTKPRRQLHNAAMGGIVTFLIQVSIYPDVNRNVTWKKIGNKNSGFKSNRFQDSKNSADSTTDGEKTFWLRIASVWQSDYGIYQCRIRTKYSDITYNFTLEEIQAPMIPTDVKVSSLTDNSVEVEFRSEMTGANTQVFLLYLYEDEALPGREYGLKDPGQGKMKHYTIAGLRPETGYNIMVRARNNKNLLSEYTKSIKFITSQRQTK